MYRETYDIMIYCQQTEMNTWLEILVTCTVSFFASWLSIYTSNSE